MHESPIYSPKISILGGLTPKFGEHHIDPQKAHPCMARLIWSPRWSRSEARCELKKTKK